MSSRAMIFGVPRQPGICHSAISMMFVEDRGTGQSGDSAADFNRAYAIMAVGVSGTTQFSRLAFTDRNRVSVEMTAPVACRGLMPMKAGT